MGNLHEQFGYHVLLRCVEWKQPYQVRNSTDKLFNTVKFEGLVKNHNKSNPHCTLTNSIV